MTIRTMASAAALLAAAALFAPIPAWADETSDLELMSQATETAEQGMALAREEISRNELLIAAATLQRLMINHPEALPAQLLHATLLCRLDDRTGAAVEFEGLRRKDFKDTDWSEAMAPCADKPNAG